jgi:hypothetical protein
MLQRRSDVSSGTWGAGGLTQGAKGAAHLDAVSDISRKQLQSLRWLLEHTTSVYVLQWIWMDLRWGKYWGTHTNKLERRKIVEPLLVTTSAAQRTRFTRKTNRNTTTVVRIIWTQTILNWKFICCYVTGAEMLPRTLRSTSVLMESE